MAKTNVGGIIPDLITDCETIVKLYVEKDTTSFAEFIKLWKSLEFDLIYAGQGEVEIDYFVLHVLHVAKRFCQMTSKKQERVAGLYLLYMLYYTEPLKIKKPIRLVPEEFLNLKSLAEEYKHINKEVPYAFYKLLLDNGFDFVVTSLPYDESLLHFKEELKARGTTTAELQLHKLAVQHVTKETGLDMTKWSEMVSNYNNLKKKINNCCSLNLDLTKGIDYT